jgi:hypothetical protein
VRRQSEQRLRLGSRGQSGKDGRLGWRIIVWDEAAVLLVVIPCGGCNTSSVLQCGGKHAAAAHCCCTLLLVPTGNPLRLLSSLLRQVLVLTGACL